MSQRKTRTKEDPSQASVLGVDLADLESTDDEAWASAADALAEALAQTWEEQATLDAAARKRLSVLRKPSGRWITATSRASDRSDRNPQD